jgi:D-glycero-alpha-D-manno-heptose-7-phosphate kinase
VGLLNALNSYTSTFVTKEQLARDACKIEIDLLGAPIGKQDQYLAAYGGLQFIQFNPDGSVFLEPIACTVEFKRALEDKLMLFYTGQARDAGSILAKQQAITAEQQQFKLLKKMKDIALEMRELLVRGKDLRKFGELLHEEWTNKKNLTEGISNVSIDEYYARALAAGAIGGKLCGAGGGGFLLLYCEEFNQQKVREALQDLKEVDFSFESYGSSIVSVC